MAETPSKPAAYLPMATAASLRIAESVIGRLGDGAPVSGNAPRPSRETGTADYVTVTGPAVDAQPRSPAPAAVPASPKSLASDAPSMPLLHSGKSDTATAATSAAASTAGPQAAERRDGQGFSKAAQDASLKMLEALHAHASAQALAGGGNRINLGDMATIAFADQNKQFAASADGLHSSAPAKTAESAPEGDDSADLEAAIEHCAEAVIAECKKQNEMNRARGLGF